MWNKNVPLRLLRLTFGLFVLSAAIVLQINANLGYAPWTVLNHGIHRQTGMTIGQASILVSAIVIGIDLIAKEKIGMGTITNMILTGIFTDWIIAWDILPHAAGLADGLVLICASIVTTGFGVYLYIGAGYGAGPRDSLMVAAIKFSGKPLGLCRSSLEVCALALGFLLGGSVGIGTVVLSLCTGIVMQYIFKLFKFNPKTIKHEYLDDQIKQLISLKKAHV